jgi:hypothetical protein
VFHNIHIPVVNKRNPADIRGATFQRHAITIAQEGMTAFQCIDERVATNNFMQFDIAQTYFKDFITITSTIDKIGSIQRLYVGNTEIARTIKHRDEKQVFTLLKKSTVIADAFAFGKVKYGFTLFNSDSFELEKVEESLADKDFDELGVFPFICSYPQSRGFDFSIDSIENFY